MALVRRLQKLQPVSAAEYDAVVDQVEVNQGDIQVIAGQFADSQVTLSFADLATATAYWTAQDGASNTPTDEVEIYIQDVKQFFKWNAANAAKAVYSRDFSDALKADKTVVDPIKEKTDNLNNTNDGILYITDNNGKIIAKINSDGINTTKYNLCDTSGNVIGTFDSSLLTTIGNKANAADVLDEYQYNSMMDVANPSTGEFVNYNTATQVLTIPHDTVLLSKNGDDNINVVGDKNIDISAVASPVKIVYNTDTNIFRGITATTDLDPLERVFCFVRKVNPDISINCGYTVDGVDIRKNLALKADKTEIDAIKEKTVNIIKRDDNFGIVDANGNVVFLIDNSGVKSKEYHICDVNGNITGTINKSLYDQIVAKINEEPTGGGENIIDVSEYADGFYIVAGNTLKPFVGLQYDADGFDVAKLSEHFKTLLPNQIKLESTFNGDFQVHILYGQSLAFGGRTINFEDFYTSKMFEKGTIVAANYDTLLNANNETLQEDRFGSIVDMDDFGGGVNARMICKKINELIRDENGYDLDNFQHNQFGFITGKSGGSWDELTKWNESRTTQFVDVQQNAMPTALAFNSDDGKAYLNLMQGIYFINKFAKSQGKKAVIASISYIQSEHSNDRANTLNQFKTKLNTLFNDIKADVPLITGQSQNVKFFTYQNASFAIYADPLRPEYDVNTNTEGPQLALVEITKERSDTFFGTPLYPFSRTIKYTGDLLHLDNIGYSMYSSMFAVAIKRAVNDNNPLPTFSPIVADKEIWENNSSYFIYIPFDVPVKPLVFDVEGVSGVNMRGHGLQPNYGFEILNNSDVDIITNVKLSSDNAVIITTSENPVGLDLTYALTGTMGGGNLRDSQGETIKTSFNNSVYRLDNWCPFFRITL
jgi:hypothetical protein